METASHVLSALSQNVGIVVSPSLADNRLNHIEFVLAAGQANPGGARFNLQTSFTTKSSESPTS
jgi:hypothetical protein